MKHRNDETVGYDPVVRPSPDGAGMETVAGPRSSAMIVGQVSDLLWLPVDSNVHAYFVKGNENASISKKDYFIEYNANRQVSRIRSTGMDTSFTYDAIGNLLSAVDTIRAKTTLYTYNTGHDLIKIQYPDGKINEFVYDAKGMVQQMKNNDGTSVNLTRNAAGDIVSITDEANRTVILERDIMGRVIKETGPSGRIVRYEWGASSCESCGSEKKLTKIIDSGNKQWEFKYDMMGNVIEMIYPDLSKIEQRFDLAGRLEWFKNKRGQEITYAYDADGNLVQERNKASGETKKYFYNSENRLTAYEHYANEFTSVDQIAQYTYDLYGRRIQKTVNGMVTNFLWDEDNISLELNENNQPIRRYVYGVGMDNVEGHFEYAEATSNPFATDKKGWYTYIKDQVGTIYKTFSHGTSQVVNSRAYDTFGNLISQSGTSKSPLGFQSKYFDQESGLYYFYNRYYSSNIGRFITGDPLGPEFDTNLYRFVWNNPISTTDPMGLAPVPYEPSECCKEKKTLEKRLKLVNFLIKYFSSTPPPTANPIHGPEGKELTPVGSSSGWTHPGLTKCEKRCVDIHEATPSHVNAGAMNFAAAELQGYTYEKLCLEYEMGIIHQWRWPFR